MKECSGKKVLIVKVSQNDPLSLRVRQSPKYFVLFVFLDHLKLMMLILSHYTDHNQNQAKRSKYSEGICPQRFKNSGVKKLIIIGTCPETKEGYHNCKTMMEEAGIEGVEQSSSGTSADIKMQLILLGRPGGAGSTYNCPVGNGKKPWTGKNKCELITLGFIRRENERFEADGRPMANAKNYTNSTERSLLAGRDEDLLIDLLFLPGLHMSTGITGKLSEEIEASFDDKVVGRNFMDKFLKEINVKRSEYHGMFSFEGNQARKLLKKIDKLMDYAKRLPRKHKSRVKQIIEVMKAFDLVVESCFCVHLQGDYVKAIKDFSDKYRALDITVPPKVHLVEDHVVQFIERRHPGLGLGAYTEQSFEAAHHDFKVEWERTKVPLDHSEHGPRYLDTVVRYVNVCL